MSTTTEHSREQIRSAALEILSRDAKSGELSSQYVNLKSRIAEAFQEQEPPQPSSSRSMVVRYSLGGDSSGLSQHDANIFLEVFWELFREGIICLGANDLNPQFPFFRVTSFGVRVLQDHGPLTFEGASAYEIQLKSRVPQIHPTSLILAGEAAQAYEAGRMLSAAVVIGTALKYSWDLLIDAIQSNPDTLDIFKESLTESATLCQLEAVQKVLERHPELLPPAVRENLQTQFIGVASSILGFRDISGKGDEQSTDREHCYALLQLFIPCCQKLYQLIEVFKQGKR